MFSGSLLPTLWHTEFSERKAETPHDLIVRFPKPAVIEAVLITQRQEMGEGILDGLTKRLRTFALFMKFDSIG